MISIIVPFHNEEESLPILHKEIVAVMEKIGKEYEVVYVDDGSTDASFNKIQILKPKLQTNSKIQIIKNIKKKGKGEALRVGVENAKGDIIVFIDADLQDDPKDLENFLKKINEGYDFVNGVRKKRHDNFFVKTYSAFASFILKQFLHSPFTDINCGFKVFKKEVLKDFYFYGNNFRFFPLAVFYQSYKVTEVIVTNNSRRFGTSKFGANKLFIGILDMIGAYFIFRFSEKPLHFFGSIGGSFFLTGFIIALYLSFERIFFNVLLYRRPALQFAILLIIVGVQILMTGIIGELIVYLNKKQKKD